MALNKCLDFRQIKPCCDPCLKIHQCGQRCPVRNMRRSFINMHAMSNIKLYCQPESLFDCTQWSHLSENIKSWKWNFPKLVNQQVYTFLSCFCGDDFVWQQKELFPLSLIWCSWIWNQSPSICNIMLTIFFLSLLNLSLLLQNILDRALNILNNVKILDIFCTEQRRQSYLPSGMNMQ